MSIRPKLGIIIVAGGSGKRAERHRGDVPKQYRKIRGRTIFEHTICAFVDMENIDWIQPVIGDDHRAYYENMNLEYDRLLLPVTGGNTRQQSVLAGLKALQAHNPDIVMIHDAARPFVMAQTVKRIVEALKTHDGALPMLPVTDTIKRSSDGKSIDATQNRDELWAAQTPQGFDFSKIFDAHKAAIRTDICFTDDGSIAEWAGLDMVLVQGNSRTFKITTIEDFARAQTLLEGNVMMETRVGTALDIHQFEPGDCVRLGGVDIAHDAKLKGHSDADAALHVLTDALLGALAEGDIGQHFPPSEAKWKGEPSDTFLSFAAERVRKRDGRIVHLDLTIVCEAPKIGPNTINIRQNVAKICNISIERVSVKATTAEQMGFIGRREGLMTMASATIEVPRGED